ncbi:MAG: NAD(P)-dependent oxidoreductase [Bacteroidetes bacterium]|nr:NAD(P)-dependent oxidoreductase [Bacteroidota bacterium]
MSKIKNLVLGGSGMIGTHLCEYLRSKGEEVISLDLLDGFDLRKDNLDRYKDVDFVWFLAWEVGGSKFLNDKDNFISIIKNNTQICSNVFQFLEDTKIPFLFASTQLAAPDNVYGVTKLLGENWTKALGGKIVRFWNVYGWEDPGERSHVITDMVLNALKNKHIQLMTNGEEERQFIYAEDCVRNLYKIKSLKGAEFDLSDGQWISIKDLGQLIAEKLDARVSIGSVKGYNNRMDPKHNVDQFEFEFTLSKGIDRVIDYGKKFLTR